MKREDGLKIFSIGVTILLLTLGVSVLTMIDYFRDHGIILGVLSGSFLYEDVKKIIETKIINGGKRWIGSTLCI